MILESLEISTEAFQTGTGWELRPEGACKGERCVPIPELDAESPAVDIRVLSDRLGMPIVHDQTHNLYALGPESGGKLLAGAQCPEIVLPDLERREFALSSLRGRKVVLVAWASW